MRLLVVVALVVIVGAAFGRHYKKHHKNHHRIIGGTDALKGQFPHQVSLQLKTYGHTCGGSILSKRWVLSAGHCIARHQNPKLFIVEVGSITLRPPGIKHAVSKLILNEEFVKTFNDICVIYLKRGIEFNDYVAPISIGATEIGDGKEVVISGWGEASFLAYRALPNVLQFIKLKVISNQRCQKLWGKFSNLTETHICTLTKSGEGICLGDSGGALTADGKVVGIASYVSPCARNIPDVFTRVSRYANWIKKHAEL